MSLFALPIVSFVLKHECHLISNLDVLGAITSVFKGFKRRHSYIWFWTCLGCKNLPKLFLPNLWETFSDWSHLINSPSIQKHTEEQLGFTAHFGFPGGFCFELHHHGRIFILLYTEIYSNIFRIQVVHNEKIICLRSTATELALSPSLQSGYIIEELFISIPLFLLR